MNKNISQNKKELVQEFSSEDISNYIKFLLTRYSSNICTCMKHSDVNEKDCMSVCELEMKYASLDFYTSSEDLIEFLQKQVPKINFIFKDREFIAAFYGTDNVHISEKYAERLQISLIHDSVELKLNELECLETIEENQYIY